jgi:hypothetical protein
MFLLQSVTNHIGRQRPHRGGRYCVRKEFAWINSHFTNRTSGILLGQNYNATYRAPEYEQIGHSGPLTITTFGMKSTHLITNSNGNWLIALRRFCFVSWHGCDFTSCVFAVRFRGVVTLRMDNVVLVKSGTNCLGLFSRRWDTA